MFKDYFKIAFNGMRRRQLRSWLTILGIIIGITTVVALISLGQGMQNAIENQFFQLGADKLTIQTKGISTGPPGSNSDIQLKIGDLRTIQATKGVDVATARIIEPITVEFNDEEKALYLASLPQDTEERELITTVANVQEGDMIYGRALRSGDRWKVIMSTDYYDNPKFDGKTLQVGDKITINGQAIDVVGFYAKTGNPFVDLSFVMNEDAMRDLLDIPEKIGMIIAQVSPGEDMGMVAANVEKELRKYRGVSEGKEDFEVQSAEDLLDTFSTVLSIVTAVLVGIAGISLLVGSVGIMNTMYTSVLERHKEIGVMKAIGARNSDIMIIFLIESGLIGLVGGIIGISLGMLFGLAVQWIAVAALGTMLIQAHFPWYLILGSLMFSFIVGSLAGTFPAYLAGKLHPVEALRK